MTPDPVATLLQEIPEIAAVLQKIPDPILREVTCRYAIKAARQVRAEALRELHAKLGSWEKVGEAVGLPRQDAWRMGTGRG